MANYSRSQQGIRFSPGSIQCYKSLDLLGDGEYAYLANVRGLLGDRLKARPTQSTPAATMGSGPVHTIRRLNDTTPAGPVSGFTLIGGSATSLYNNSAAVASGLSGNPLSFVPFRPNTSVQPWMYIGDSSLAVTIIAGSFNCAGMLKVRSDGLTRKDGIAEPQAAPTVSFPGGGSGPSPIFYYYVYRASETGALSNPSPVSVPGTNSQSSPSASVPATSYLTNYTFNAAQWEFVGTQLRTKSPTPNGTLDFVVVRGMGFAIPAGVTINGVQIDLNWVGQNAGTGTLSSVALYYLGNQIGVAKFPGINNQSFSSDAFQGGSGDSWGTVLTPDIINDASFGFGVQITKQDVGGTNRSFINFMAATVYYSTQSANITPTPSADPQVDKIDFYRQGGGLANPTYVGTNPNTATVFNDTLSDLAAAANPEMQLDNFEPFPSIDLPRRGVLNASGQVLTYVSGDHFNIRWLPGTIMLIGASTQLAFSAPRRPASTTSWDFTNNDPTVTPIPDGPNLVWNIAEPILAAQPLPSLWGPTDNTAYMFGCYDPLRPGTLYYTKGNNPDSAPDTNQIEVTSPSEPLMNGAIINGIGMVFSTERAWLIYPTFTTALATVNGIEGQAFNLIESIADRGLYIRPAICVAGGKTVFFRGKDGIYASGGNGAQSITDAQLYNLFPHEGFLPSPVVIGPFTIYPPDDSQPEKQKLHYATGCLYYDYVNTSNTPITIVMDAASGWVVDVYQFPATTHALEEGPAANDTLVGCSDGSVRRLGSGNAETATSIVATGALNFGDVRGFERVGDTFMKALAMTSNPIAIAMYTELYAATVTGYAPTTLTGTGVLDEYIIDFSNGFAKDVNDLEVIFSWNTAALNNYISLWQPSYIELPEVTQDRPSDWDNLGDDGNKFIQGLALEFDTFGQNKTFAIQDETGALHTPSPMPINSNGQTIKSFSFAPPFVARQVRIVTTDGVPWRLFNSGDGIAKWYAQPFPESATTWTTESFTYGMNGWIHCYLVNLAYICSAAVVVTLQTDQGNFVLNYPAAGVGNQPGKILVKAPRNKWKVSAFSVTSTAPIYLWKDLCEIWLKPWGSQDAYIKISPFGGSSTTAAEV